MPKMVVPKSIKKAEFTDYTLADTVGGTIRAAVLRENYEREQMQIGIHRQLGILASIDNPEHIGHQAQPRGGYPHRRYINPDLPSKRGASKLLHRFKMIGGKIYMLHATRGWKAYA